MFQKQLRNFLRLLLAVGLICTFGSGCRSREKPKTRFDGLDGGAPPLREECDMPAVDCYDRCHKRKASVTCIGCCRDQEFLCDTQQAHSFDACDSAP